MGKQTKANPYPYGNFALTLDFLEELITVVSKEKSLIAIDAEGYEDIFLEQDKVQQLHVPEHAVSAMLMVEALAIPQTTNGVIMRVKENGSDPSGVSGFGLGHQDTFEVHGRSNLSLFKTIALVDQVALRVQYYQSAKQQEN